MDSLSFNGLERVAIETWLEELEKKKMSLVSLLKQQGVKSPRRKLIKEQIDPSKKGVLREIDLIEKQITTISKLDMVSQEQAVEREKELLLISQQRANEKVEAAKRGSIQTQAKGEKLRAEALRRVIMEEMAKIVQTEKNEGLKVPKKENEKKREQKIGQLMFDERKKWQKKREALAKKLE